LVIGGRKVPCQAQCDSFRASAIFPGLVTAQIFLFLQLKGVLKRTIRECWGSHCKSNDSTDRVIKKWFPEMLPKVLQTLEKVCHCSRELFWRKGYLSKCKGTYFCVINHFQELLEAICTTFECVKGVIWLRPSSILQTFTVRSTHILYLEPTWR
jgi:hypothetical protein